MICKNPFMRGNLPLPCGSCLPCRVNRRNVWTWRQVLESYTHDENCFVTLTYNDEHLPPSGSLVPEDVTNFIKRLRYYVDTVEKGKKFRYYLVGEYGDQSLRPHYHLSVFGLGQLWQNVMEKAWSPNGVSMGFVMCAEFNRLTAQYVAGYVTKKLNNGMSDLYDGVLPEFTRSSRNPGIGCPALSVIASALNTPTVSREILKKGDAPYIVRVGSRSVAIGRYLHNKLRQYVNLDESVIDAKKQENVDKYFEELFNMWARHKGSKKIVNFKEAYQETVKGKIANVEGRSKIQRSKRTEL